MRQISTEELIAKGVTRYSLIIGISKRAREIAEYNDSMAIQPEHKPILQAAEEYMEGMEMPQTFSPPHASAAMAATMPMK